MLYCLLRCMLPFCVGRAATDNPAMRCDLETRLLLSKLLEIMEGSHTVEKKQVEQLHTHLSS